MVWIYPPFISVNKFAYQINYSLLDWFPFYVVSSGLKIKNVQFTFANKIDVKYHFVQHLLVLIE